VLGEVLRQEGAMVEVQRVEAKKVLEQVQMIHVVQDVIMPTVYNKEDLEKAVSLENETISQLSKSLDLLYPPTTPRPSVFFSLRPLPRTSFPSLFTRDPTDGTLLLRVPALYDHHLTRTNVYHFTPTSGVGSKDSGR
jgi:hypothetical protein